MTFVLSIAMLQDHDSGKRYKLWEKLDCSPPKFIGWYSGKRYKLWEKLNCYVYHYMRNIRVLEVIRWGMVNKKGCKTLS